MKYEYPMIFFIFRTCTANDRPLSQVVNSKAESNHILTWDGVDSIPAIPNAQYVPSLLCHERFNEASLPARPTKISGTLEYQTYHRFAYQDVHNPRIPIHKVKNAINWASIMLGFK